MTTLLQLRRAPGQVTQDVTLAHAARARGRDDATRVRWAEELAARLDAPIAVLGLVLATRRFPVRLLRRPWIAPPLA